MSEKIFYNRPGRFLYGNVELQSVRADEAEGTLILRVVYAEREVQKIIYNGVYASQISPSLVGVRISLAEEVPLAILNDRRYIPAARQLFFVRDWVTPGFVSRLQQAGNKLYRHYISRQSECLVVARKVEILLPGS